jgi:hypothetical protein
VAGAGLRYRTEPDRRRWCPLLKTATVRRDLFYPLLDIETQQALQFSDVVDSAADRMRYQSDVVLTCYVHTSAQQGLDDADKLQALHLRGQARGFELPDDVGGYLLLRLPRDMHALFAVLDRLDYASLAAQRRLTVPFIKSILG